MIDFMFVGRDADEITARPCTYVDMFKKRGVVAFRDAEYSRDDIIAIGTEIGNRCDFTPSPNRDSPSDVSNADWQYLQDHDKRITAVKENSRNSPDDQLIEWHLEGVSKKHPQRAALWHMYNFKTSPENGQTGFVDMQEMLLKVPDPWRSMLDKAEIIHLPNWQHPPESDEEYKRVFEAKVEGGQRKIWTRDGDDYVASFARKAVEPNPATGIGTLRVCPCAAQWGVQDHLLLVDGKVPSKSQRQAFADFLDWLRPQIMDTKENQIWWRWQEGDLLLTDLFRMAHGVNAGYNEGERNFYGYWCYPFGSKPQVEETITPEEFARMEQ